MCGSPYLAAWRKQRSHRRRHEGVALAGRALVAVAVVAMLVPLVRPVFLGFLDAGPSALDAGVEGVTLRAGLLVVAILAIDVYIALVRGPERVVLDLLPVDAARVAEAEVVRVAWERAWVPFAVIALLSPIALAGHAGHLVTAAVVILGAWVLGLAASAFVHLLAIDVAVSDAWAPLLDLVRGHNPRAQAAFIWAPGVVLAGAGAAVMAASRGAAWAAGGHFAGMALLTLPFVAAIPCALAVPGLSRRSWFRASSVLGDIDARYAALESPDDARGVYLDWTVRVLPARWAPFVLADLRHGWRHRRTWITGAWIAGVLVALVAWSGDDGAPTRAAAAAVAGTWLVAAIGVLLPTDEAPFLRTWLHGRRGDRTAARAIVLVAWVVPVVLPASVSVGIRHGGEAAGGLLVVGLASVLVASSVSGALGRWREAGRAAYVPIAALAAAAWSAWLTRGGT